MIKPFIFLSLVFICVGCSPAQEQTSQASVPKTALDEEKTPIPAKTEKSAEEAVYQPARLDPKDIGTPTQAIKDLDKIVESYHLGQALTPQQVQENEELKQRIIRGTFDIAELCRLSLGKHWENLLREQRDHFVGLMTNLLETKAIFSKEQLRGENKLYRIVYKNQNYDDAEKTRATVYSQMNVPKEKITLDITYKLLISPYGWKIYDVIVDDASLLSNYKFQFDRIITKDGFSELITRMEKKLEELKKE